MRHHPLSPPGPLLAPWFAGPFWFWPLLILVVVELSHGAISRSREDGTLEILLATAAKPSVTVWAKYLAVCLAFIFLWVITTPLVLLLFLYIPVSFSSELPFILSGYGGAIAVGCAGLALGVMFSSFTTDTRLSAMFTFMTLFMLVLLKIILHPGMGIVSSSWLNWLSGFNFLDFMENFARKNIVFSNLATLFIIIIVSITAAGIWIGKNQNKKYYGSYISLILIAIILIEGAIIITNKYDNTRSSDGIHPLLKQRISTLNSRLKIYIFANAPSSSLYFHPIPALEKNLQNISSRTSMIDWQRIEISSNSENVLNLAKKFSIDLQRIRNDAMALSEGVIVVSYLKDFKVIPLSSVFMADVRDGKIRFSGINLESELSSAISILVNPARKKLCFTSGHGENSLEDSSPRGSFRLGLFLKRRGIVFENLGPVLGPVPARCKSVILKAPVRDFLKSELDNLTKWLNSGGHMVYFYPENNADTPDLFRWLYSAGFSFSEAGIIDRKHSVGKSSGFTWAASFENIVDLPGERMILTLPHAVFCNECESLISSSDKAKLWKSGTQKNQYSKFSIAARLQNPSKSLVTVVGFSKVWTNSFLDEKGESTDASSSFMEFIIKQASEDNSKDRISPSKIRHHHLTLRITEIRSIQFFAMVIHPLLLVFIGLFMAWRRRKS